MERRGADKPILERVLSAPGAAVVLRGPAATGKTTAAVEMYRHFTSNGRRCLFVVPNRPAAAQLTRRLLDESDSGVLVAPEVLTFDALAGRILGAAGGVPRMLSPFRRHLLLRRIAEEMGERKALRALQKVLPTPGLVAALDRAISELKRAAVEADDLARAVQAGPRAARHADLLAIYRRYQRHLLDGGFYDVEGRMWQARLALDGARGSGGEAVGLGGVAALAADGFTDFTPTQLAILKLLSERLERLLITLPCADDGRERLWHWTGRTLGRLRETLGADLVEIATGEAEAPLRGPLAAVWSRLFDFEAEPVEAPAGFAVIAAAGIDAEVAAVARRVKRLLCDGAGPGSIAVLARSLDDYRPAIERIFRAHDIPVASAPQALTDHPIVRFCLDVAALPDGDFASADVLRIIKNSYFRPQALGCFDGRTVAIAEMLIRQENVLGGREAYAAAAGRLAGRRPTSDEDGDEPSISLGPLDALPEAVRAAGEMLEALFGLAASGRGDLGLAGLIDALELEQAAAELGEAELTARDLRGLAALRHALADAGDAPAELVHLRQALSAVATPPPRREAVVDVLDVLDARALRYRHVLLLGTTEGVFPRRFQEGSLISEADRAAWRDHGVILDTRGDLTAREMLLFYLAVSRADEGLTVSFLDADAVGRPAAPGSFLQSLAETVGLSIADAAPGRVESIGPGQFLPPAGEIATPRDAFLAGLAGLFEAPVGGSAALAWAAAHVPQRILPAAMGLLAQHRRWLRGPCDRFDGRISDPALLAALKRRFPGRTIFSATQINAYAQCPWRYFAEHVLRLKPLPALTRELQAVARGIFIHNVLCRLMNALRAEAGGPVKLAAFAPQRIEAAIDQAIADEARAAAPGVRYPRLWQIQLDQMGRELRAYVESQRAADDFAAECLYFELGFGIEPGRPDALDPRSRREPAVLAASAGDIRLRGKIDRVDRVAFEDVAGLYVVDYKTGKVPSGADIDKGLDLQLPLYAAAAVDALGEGVVGGAFHGIGPKGKPTEFAAVEHGRGAVRRNEAYAEQLAEAIGRAGGHVAAMGEGRFDVLPTAKCPTFCAFRQICCYAEHRAEIKSRLQSRLQSRCNGIGDISRCNGIGDLSAGEEGGP